MSKLKKTCYYKNINKTNHNSHNKKILLAKNKIMKKTEKKTDCTMYVMPPQITDEDITALFNGIINVVRKKIELENKAEILNTNISLENTLKALREKESECIRLKNEIIYLKEKLNKNM